MQNEFQPVELVAGPFCGRHTGITRTDDESIITARILDPHDAIYVHVYRGELRLSDMADETIPRLKYEGREESNLHPSKAK